MATVIKAGDTGVVRARLSSVDLNDHLVEASRVLEKARRQAAQLVAQAEREARHRAQRIEEEARNQGRDEGLARGLDEGRTAGHEAGKQEALAKHDQELTEKAERLTQAAALFEQAAQGISETKESLRLAAERDLLEVAVQLAGKITFAIGDLRKESVVENLRRAIDRIDARQKVNVRVHPKDLAVVQELSAKGSIATVESAGVTLIADESIAPGGCLVETQHAQVDATLDTQLRELTELLLGATNRDA